MAGKARSRRCAPRVLLGVTGGIAAYKALELVRLFRRAGWDVTVVMTRAGRRFVGPESFRALSGNPVALDLFPRTRPPKRSGPVEHVDLATRADLVVIAPATANIIGKLASGIADDLLSTLLLAVPPATLDAGRVVIAPAMNANMWQHRSVQANLRRLKSQGYRFVEPESGELACGTYGPGRMAEPATVFAVCQTALRRAGPGFLQGFRVLITAGRTEEPLDPVRVITNRASGRLGAELGQAFAAAGTDVTLVAGPMSVPAPSGVRLVRVATSAEMLAAVEGALPTADVLVMCAAVADYRPVRPSRAKLHAARLELRLERTPDILKAVARRKHRALVVGFSLDDSFVRGRAKLRAKRLDLVVANPPATAGADTIQATLVFPRGAVRKLPTLPKPEFARRLVGIVAGLLRQKRQNRGAGGTSSHRNRESSTPFPARRFV